MKNVYKIPIFNYGYRKSHQFIPSFNKINSLQEHPKLQRIARLKENKTGREKKLNMEENDISDIASKKNVITECNKRNIKPFRDYIESKSHYKSSKKYIIN